MASPSLNCNGIWTVVRRDRAAKEIEPHLIALALQLLDFNYEKEAGGPRGAHRRHNALRACVQFWLKSSLPILDGGGPRSACAMAAELRWRFGLIEPDAQLPQSG
jgi:hypothetical protein